METSEIEVMRTLDELLGTLEEGPRQRVLTWANAKFRSTSGNGSATADQPDTNLPGIATLKGGEMELLFHDLKATSAVDAAVRLAHVVLFAHESLAGEKTASSRKVLLPLLRQWRLYDGNARARLAACRGIVRQGDRVFLDAPAKRYAQQVMQEILDESATGRWQPPVMGRRSGRG